jgi:hypothetical protein
MPESPWALGRLLSLACGKGEVAVATMILDKGAVELWEIADHPPSDLLWGRKGRPTDPLTLQLWERLKVCCAIARLCTSSR